MKKGNLIVYSGPSGCGKGTVREIFEKNENLNIVFSISMTTRKPRSGEIDGKHYYFVDDEEFSNLEKNNGFLESAIFAGNKYGTPIKRVNELLNEGKNVILEIEVEGALQVMSKVPEAISIFLMPPSLDALKTRLEGRATETKEMIKMRLERAKEEMLAKDKYDYVVLNDNPNNAANEITKIIQNG